MLSRLALASIAVGLLLSAAAILLSEGYSAKRGFLESLPKMTVRLTSDERRPQFSEVLQPGKGQGQVIQFEGKLVQMSYEMAELEIRRVLEAFDAQRLAKPKPNHMYLFEGWILRKGTTAPLGPVLALASALVIIGAAVLLGTRTMARPTTQIPAERIQPSISEPAMTTEVQTPVKPSRLRVALHVWGGVSMKVAADVSGLVVIRGESDVESARAAAAAAGLIAALLVLAGYYLSYRLVSSLDKAVIAPKVKRMIMVFLPFAYLAAAIVIGGIAGLFAGKS
jgi:hypothetical protein